MKTILDKDKFFEKHWNNERHYAKVFPWELWKTFTASEKEERASQIDYLEKEVLGDKAIKIRVRPRIIQKFAKLTWVSDFKWWGYWWDTIYLWHTSDLYNPQIVRHEWIHILQQREYWTTRLWWFINWVNESLFEGPKKYKKEHKNEIVTNNDLSTKPRLEMEAYSNQLDPEYIENREDNAYLQYDGKEWLQKWLRKIEKANYDLDEKILDEKLKIATEEKNREELLDAEHDLDKLEEIKDISKDRDMYVFNYVEKINDILCVVKILEEKLKQLKSLKAAWKLKIDEEWDEFDDRKNQYKASPKLRKDIESYKNEIANENLSYMFEDNFISIDTIEKTIKDLYKKCHEYRKTPTFIRLEEDWHHEITDKIWDITAALLKLWFDENSIQKALDKFNGNMTNFDQLSTIENFWIMAAYLKNWANDDIIQDILDKIKENNVDFDLWDVLEKYWIDEDNLLEVLSEVEKERLEKEKDIKKQNKKKWKQKWKYITIPLLFYKN